MSSTNIQKPKIKNPKKEGYLEKQSSFWKTYRKRWMVLQGHMLYSFKEEKQYENPTEIFDLRIYNKAKKSPDGKSGQFELSSPNDSRIFLASSEHEMKDWVKHIKSASGRQKSASTSGLHQKKRANPTSITNKINNSKKKKKTKPSAKKTPKKTPKQTPKKKAANQTKTKKKTQKSLKVTNSSMDRHIARMNRAAHAKSKSTDTEINMNSNTPSKKKKNASKKSVKKDNNRSSEPNLNNPQYRQQILQQHQQNNHSLTRRTSAHTKSASNMGLKVNNNAFKTNDNEPHRRSVSSMFRKKSRSPTVPHSQTDLTDEEYSPELRDFNLRSQSERNYKYPNNKHTRSATPEVDYSFQHKNQGTFYSVTFESKPFGLTLNPYNEQMQIGAVVMVNHNVNDQIISQASRFVSINGDPCKNYKFERIKNMCRNATLPTTIKFLDTKSSPHIPIIQPLTTSVSLGNENGNRQTKSSTNMILSTNPNQNLKPNVNNINMYNSNAPKASQSYSKKQNKQNKQNKNHSPRFTATKQIKEDKPIVEKKKTKKKNYKVSKPKVSVKTKQNRERKAAKQLMESLGGMEEIKNAEKYERLRQWKECVDAYAKGIENLEKSLKKLGVSGILTIFQQQQCQQQIDQYCRTLIKLQREHSKDIQKSNEKKQTRISSGLPRKKRNSVNKGSKRTSFGYTQKSQQSEYGNSENVEEEDEEAVFGKKPKRESAVALKRKEMARMEREMKTGKIERPDDDDDDNKSSKQNPTDDGDKPEDIYSFLDRSDATKKHKEKMSNSSTKKKKNTKKKKKKDNDKKKKKKKGKKGSKGSDDDDEKKEDKKKSKLSQQDEAFRSRLEADIISEAPDICFKDVQGLANVKLALYETIILPAMRPELFTGLRTPTGGLLLFGPPGNGKTMIAKCVAAGCKSTFFSISASSITSKFVGDAERIMRTLFDLAREKSPSIIFIDEIDSMLTARGGQNEAESSRRIKTEFLIQFDGVKKASDSAKRVLVIGATNLPAQLDEAVLRRFGKRIMVPLPDSDTRRGILRLLMSKQKTILTDEDYETIVAGCDGYSCSDLSTLCKDAAMGPIRSLGVKILEIKNQADMPAIKKCHFDESLKNVRPSLTQGSLNYFDDWNDKFGSKIHLSLSALPEDMRPYTMEELQEIERKREEKELADKAAQEAAEKAEQESSDEDSD